MSETKISVIIPVYNVEDYLEECLESCAGQDYANCEFICINDGSTDLSRQILKDYPARDRRFRVFHKENGGLSSARNAGLKRAYGDWVMFLDSDDRLKSGALEELDRLVERGNAEHTPWDIIIFHSDTFPENIENDSWYKKTLQYDPKQYLDFSADAIFEERGAMPFVWRHAYSMNLLKKTGVVFDETLSYGEDVMFPMSIFPSATRILFSDSCLYDYRLKRKGSLTEAVFSDADRIVERHYEVIRHAAQYWAGQGWLDLYGAEFLNWALKFTLLKVKALKGSQRRKRAAEMFEDIIVPYGLDKYHSSLNVKGKLMWTAFSVLK